MVDVLPYQSSDSASRVELEHGWEFLPDFTGRLLYSDLQSAAGWRSARVGLSWNAQFDDLRDFMGAAWYRMHFEAPNFTQMRHALLRFGAVDYFCEVFVNGISVGTHEGGYTPFSMDIGRVMRPGDNEIAIHVVDPPMNEAENRAMFPDMMYNEIPHGKQNWYVQNGGIWQGVRLELCPSIYVDRADITPNLEGDFEASIKLAGIGLILDDGRLALDTTLKVSVYDSSGRTVFQHSEPVGTGSQVKQIRGRIETPRLWSPDDPHLYLAEVCLEGPVKYQRRYRFGFRRFEARDGKFYLNGNPFYVIAALDQDFYPETIHTPASVEFVRDMMMKAKALGLNLLRCHLKVAHPVYLAAADEFGILVWAEMPSWSDCWFPCDHFSMRAAVRGEKMFQEALFRDWNHPCIVVNTIINESWGINLQQEEQRKWLRDAFDRVKHVVQPLGRLVVDNSPCEGNFHVKTDIEDFHQYYSMPDQAPLWDKWLEQLASRPQWTFSPFGDADRSGREPLMVSEFGNWGLPKLPEDEKLPWWFTYSFGGREITTPSGVFDRFRDLKLSPLFRNYNEFAEESQWHQFISLKHQIETIRSYPSIQGHVVTGMTDVHWEANGLLDMWRNHKIFVEPLSQIQQQDVILAKLSRRTCFSGEDLEASISISHYSRRDLSGARVRWMTESGATGVLDVGTILPSGVESLGDVQWNTSEVQRPTVDRLYMELRSRTGVRLAENFTEVFVMPKTPVGEIQVRFRDSQNYYPELLGQLEAAGYLTGDEMLIATSLDDHVEEYLAQGRRVLLLIDSESAIPDGSNLSVKGRTGSELDGRWFSNFNWIRSDRDPFRQVAFGRILGFESASVVPNLVFQNVPSERFDDVLSAATFGWLQKTSPLAMQVRYGSGSMFATTYRFHDYGKEAYCTSLLNAMIRYTLSQDCAPKFELTAKQVR